MALCRHIQRRYKNTAERFIATRHRRRQFEDNVSLPATPKLARACRASLFHILYTHIFTFYRRGKSCHRPRIFLCGSDVGRCAAEFRRNRRKKWKKSKTNKKRRIRSKHAARIKSKLRGSPGSRGIPTVYCFFHFGPASGLLIISVARGSTWMFPSLLSESIWTPV